MRRVPLALALVSFGHLAYVAGSLDPITASTVFDLLTAILLGSAAWAIVAGAVDAFPRVLLLTFLMLGLVKPVDYLLSFGSGWQPFHVGWTFVALGGILLVVGAFAILRGGDGPRGRRWVRYGAWASALGSADYAVLAVLSLAQGAAGSATFLVGALTAGAGWATLALASGSAHAQVEGGAGHAPSP